LASNDDLTRPT